MTRAGAWALAVALASLAHAQFVPPKPRLAGAVQAAIDSPALCEDERRDLRMRHGQWTDADLDTATRRAQAALDTWSLHDTAFTDPAVPVAWRAEALVRRGRAGEAFSLLAGCDEPRCALVRAEALDLLGRVPEAIAQLEPLVQAAGQEGASGEALRLGARAVLRLGTLQPVPAALWKRSADWLARTREADRLDPEVPRLEGELLIARHNREEGVPALQQSLERDLRSAATWFALGRAALDGFDFDSAAKAADALRALDPAHPLADLLDGERFLVQEDPERAQRVVSALLSREPDMPEALALAAAVAARRWDTAGTDAQLAAMDARFPGQALGAATVGRLLSLCRQYEWAERMLREAVRRRPAWAEPRGELGQLLMQTGRSDDARVALAEAAELDPFDKRSAFGRWLLDEMAGYRTVETPHFRIRVKPGVDEVVADGMPDALERMHREVASRFGHEPAQRTTIEVLPDHAFFGVRITGMPAIHTMAASTGPVIALEVPRRGNPKKHLGTFDWLEVLRHEYTHTVTLSQTGNRIPHWLTEALAVSMETKPRSLQTCELLARSLETGRLFPLDRIKWAFVRPETPEDRPLGYAQGRWMVEFLEATWGADVVPSLLARYRQGDDEDAALRATIGIGQVEFFDRFKEWARGQVRAWGLATEPSIEALSDAERASDPALRAATLAARKAWLDASTRAFADRVLDALRPGSIGPVRWPKAKMPKVEITDALLDRWLSEHPDQPDLLELKIRRRLKEQPEVNATTRALLDAYRKARPVDPMPDRTLAAAATGADAITHLRRLDDLEERDPAYALELARLLRAQGDLAGALGRAEKAARIDGYDPATRELAAAIAIEAGRFDAALRHLQALERLEPDQPRHAERVKRLRELMQRAAAPAATR